MGLFRGHLVKHGAVLHLVIFPVNTYKWLVNAGSHGQSVDCIESVCSSQLHFQMAPKAISASAIVCLTRDFTPIAEVVPEAHTSKNIHT